MIVVLARLAASRLPLAFALAFLLVLAPPSGALAQEDQHQRLRTALATLRGDAPLEEKQKALRLLACVSDELMVAAVTEALLRDPKEEVRRAAAAALDCTLLSRLRGLPDLASALASDRADAVRLEVARTLRVTEHRAALEALERAVRDDPTPEVRRDAARHADELRRALERAPRVASLSAPGRPDPPIGFPIDETIVLAFDVPVNPLTVLPGTVSLVDPFGSRVPVLVRPDLLRGLRLTLTPATALVPNTPYTVVVNPAVEDARGEPLAAPLRFTFLTEVRPWLKVTAVRAARVDIPPEYVISVRFNRPVDPLTVTSNSFQVTIQETGEVYEGTIRLSRDRRVIFFTPGRPFPVRRTVSLTLTSDLADAVGNPLEKPFTTAWSVRAGAKI
ncbi:MAG: Ig-like domain-containing protein [candidate division NC10 bacterium]|nr:Ig-like domain-containing protein [candidate division NC10 bacterium]